MCPLVAAVQRRSLTPSTCSINQYMIIHTRSDLEYNMFAPVQRAGGVSSGLATRVFLNPVSLEGREIVLYRMDQILI
jgi:hypothetical protein